MGVAKTDTNEKWKNKSEYVANEKFYKDIQRFGWENFDHEILYENLSYSEAKILKTKIIEKYDSLVNGYNSSHSDIQEFPYFDFADLNNKPYSYKNTVNYFTRIPNMFIQQNINQEFGLNRIFLVVYILIDRNRTYEDHSYITIGQILKMCNYKTTRKKPKIFYEIIKSLLFLQENYFINADFNYHTIGYDECIPIEIITENFDAKNNFTKIYGKSLDLIFNSNTKLSKESILTVYLYILSFIGSRSRKDDGTEYSNAKDNPEAFWKSIKSITKDLSISKDTINQCLQYLTTSSDERPALLIKKEVGNIQQNPNKPPQNIPNIYVLNKKGYKQEIEWAMQKIKETYKVEFF